MSNGRESTHGPAWGSRYRFEERRGGFRITAEGGNPVDVTRERLAFCVSYDAAAEAGRRVPVVLPVGLFQFRWLCAAVARGLLAAWTPPAGTPGWCGAREWALRRTEWAVTKRLHACWRELCRVADPTVLNVQRALFAANFGAPPLTFCPELYQDRWLVQDICRYRAAAIAVSAVPLLAAVRRRRRECPGASVEDLYCDPFVEDASSPGSGAEACAAELCDWRSLYSVDGYDYRSLNRTLMHLPGGVSPNLLRYLPLFRLNRPIVHRLGLILALCWAEANSILANAPEENARIVLDARVPEIIEAMRRVSDYLRVDWSPRRTRDIGALARFLADYPDVHRGRLVGLADRAIIWHRRFSHEVLAETLDGLGRGTLTTVPPIRLPQPPEIRFLDTVGAVAEEGASMRHCIASYAHTAVEGESYLFHVEHGGETASVQVSRTGRVVQAFGPANTRNGASAWAARVLGRWGRALRPDVEDPPGP